MTNTDCAVQLVWCGCLRLVYHTQSPSDYATLVRGQSLLVYFPSTAVPVKTGKPLTPSLSLRKGREGLFLLFPCSLTLLLPFSP